MSKESIYGEYLPKLEAARDYLVKEIEVVREEMKKKSGALAFFQLKRDTKSHLNLCCERLFCRAADLLHPGKQFV